MAHSEASDPLGLCPVGRRQNLDDQDGIANIVFLRLIPRAGHGEIGDAEILIGVP